MIQAQIQIPTPTVTRVTDPLDIVQQQLLAPAGLDLESIDRALGELMARNLDYGDLYFQSTRYESWSVEDGTVREGVYSIDRGVGVRAISGEKTGFAYADQLDMAALIDAAHAARGIAQTAGEGRIKVATAASANVLYPYVDPLPSLEDLSLIHI